MSPKRILEKKISFSSKYQLNQKITFYRKKSVKVGLAKSLKQLQQQMEHGRDVSRVFGVEFENLMVDIERNLDKFSTPPVGPVGRHVRLVGQAARDQDLCNLIESDLGRGRLRTFLVKTMDDQRYALFI